jgi:hypothetical protein
MCGLLVIGGWSKKKRWLDDVCEFAKVRRDGYLDLGTELRCLG